MSYRSFLPASRQTLRTVVQVRQTTCTLRQLHPTPTTSSKRITLIHTRNMATDTIARPAGMMSNRYHLGDMPDLSGKVALVTGGSRGIGQAAVTALVNKGCEVHLVGATQAHLDQAIQEITNDLPSAKSLLHPHQVNFESLSDVISFGGKLNSSLPRLDMLFLIAGVGVAPYRLSQDGLSVHWGTNHLAHMVLADQLLPKLKETSEKKQSGSEIEKYSTRIVSESSELHRTAGDVKLESLEEVNSEMDANRMYSRSKLYTILFTKNLAQRLPTLTSKTPIIAAATHPGAVGTEQQKGATQAYGLLGKVIEAAGNTVFMTKEQGCESALWAGTADAVVQRREEVHGGYFTEADGKAGTESEQAKDSELIKRLWELSVQQLKKTANYDLKSL